MTKAGASVLMGKDKDNKPGVEPMDILLAGLAGCTMMDIIEILRKKRQAPTNFEAIVRGNQRVDEYSYSFTEYQIEYLLRGDNLKGKDIEHAIQLLEDKYCSVGGTLAKSGPIHSTYRNLKPGESI